MNRDIDGISCSCGGNVKEVVPTDDEEKKFGCGRKGCCVAAYLCQKCKTRFTFSLSAPEYLEDY